jgi:hypothetical protein
LIFPKRIFPKRKKKKPARPLVPRQPAINPTWHNSTGKFHVNPLFSFHPLLLPQIPRFPEKPREIKNLHLHNGGSSYNVAISNGRRCAGIIRTTVGNNSYAICFQRRERTVSCVRIERRFATSLRELLRLL